MDIEQELKKMAKSILGDNPKIGKPKRVKKKLTPTERRLRLKRRKRLHKRKNRIRMQKHSRRINRKK